MEIILEYKITGNDMINAGHASSAMKKALNMLGIKPVTVKRAAIAMYEAEINSVIHAGGGTARIRIYPDHIDIEIADKGPGIPDVELAMKEGWSTAPDSAREMGFGAGMGLPNIKKHSDDMRIETRQGEGTTIYIRINY
ncbi:MAG: ATP-binding protein [Saccharofermentanales bacterium]